MRRISVFCGSQTGNDPLIIDQARILGSLLAENEIELVYGGTNIGIMGILADCVMAVGGKVEGVIPSLIEEKRLAHKNLTRMIEVSTLEERKERLIKDSDAIVVFPGSYGTLDELFSALVLKQLGIIDKPVVVLNIGGFYDSLLAQLDHMVKLGFMQERFRSNLQVVSDCRELHFLWD
ncbi:MAG TPA: TIGR00730 family Rossman fold protein [Bacteroidales bacterium]|nr:MAG: LOG family protein YvdD [Bacteroidetes bacterium ADurb.Bin037]HPV88383.1 TIGR00730 family Rossman fold protein [Bacteroidales bacterium]HPW78086.1 TIGR00730 family Rossman fold protein [Bacteroidales bacterium]HQB56574.1 TIGR00730 family Rossman fold protein [Bacteroidales bacterium]